VIARLFALADPLPGARPRIRELADGVTPDARAGDFAQAMMDLGATICTPRSPKCLLCPLATGCRARGEGRPEAYPVKTAKRARPTRHGTIFWAERDGAVLLVRRPAKGLLGGMRALPTGPWQDAPASLEGAPFAAPWTLHNATVSHGFTHFELVSTLASVTIDGHSDAIAGEWWPIAELDSAGLPTVFAKAADMMRRMR
jgi:A/G-specific adenine glycosylase